MDTNTKDIIFNLPENQFIPHTDLSLERNFTILVRSEDYQPDLLSQLEAIMKSIQVDIHQDAHIIEIPGQVLCRIPEFCPASDYIFIFGLSPEQTGLQIKSGKYVLDRTGTSTFLFTDDLETIKTNVEAKKKLWMCLKSHFINKI